MARRQGLTGRILWSLLQCMLLAPKASHCFLQRPGYTLRTPRGGAATIAKMNFFQQFMPKPQSTPADVYRPDPTAPLAGLPTSYDAIYQSAVLGVLAALEREESAGWEVDFPPLANTNALGDGSARSEALVHEANAKFAAELEKALAAAGRTVVLVGCSAGAAKALGPQALRLGDAAKPGALPDCDVVVCVAPAVEEQWEAANGLAEGAFVVIVNGLISNGQMPHAFFYRPMTAYSRQTGAVVRQYPGAYECYDWRGNKVEIEVKMTTLGNRALPDTMNAQLVLQGIYGEARDK